jgi:branched-chain amino acid transport system permease protein
LTHFLNNALLGVPYGCDYALMAVGLVITFRTTGVFNLAFGAQAFAAAFAYDLLNQYRGWPQWASLIVAVGVISPALGLAFDRFLFRHIPTASTTVKVVSSLGLLIAIPQLIPVLFGSGTRNRIAYLWLSPGTVYFHLGASPVNGLDVSTVVITVVVVLGLIAMFRWSPIGMEMRAVVESRRLSQLHGVNSPRVAAFAWAFASAIAGLSGVLLLPALNNLDPTSTLEFTTLLVAGMTAAAFASMRSIPIGAIAGVGIGVLEYVLALYIPSTSVIGKGLVPSLPFALLVIVLIANPKLRTLEDNSDPLSAVDPPPPPPAVSIRDPRLDIPMRWGFRILIVAFLVSCLTWVPDNWVLPFGQGLCYSVIFLSLTLITGMSGQLSLCQAAFAGIGAFTGGQLAVHYGMSILLGSLIGAVIAAALGMAVSVVVSRVSGLLLTLVTLAFALFCDTVLFQFSWVGGGITGVLVPRPTIGSLSFEGDRSFLLLVFVVLLICIALVKFVQVGTTGRFLAAMRGSRTATASLGISLTRSKITVFALSAGLAGLGGALLGSSMGTIGPISASDFNYVYSLVFVVVVITTGSRTVEGAVQAGMGFAVIAEALTYLPQSIHVSQSGLEFILFAFGALTYAAHPEGVVEYQKSQWLRRTSRLFKAWDDRRARRDGGLSPPSADGGINPGRARSPEAAAAGAAVVPNEVYRA